MSDTITCNRCHNDIEYPDWVAHRDSHVTGFQPPEVTPSTAEREPYDPETYVPKWQRESILLGGTDEMPSLNPHLVHNQPRKNTRPAALDEAIERKRNRPQDRPSGHSLIR